MFLSRRARRWIALALVLAATLVPSSLASSSSPPSGSGAVSSFDSVSRRLLGRQSRWHHAMFEEIRGEVRRSAHSFLHDRTDNPLRLPLEVNVVLVGFDGEGGFRHSVDERALADFLRDSFGRYRPSCLETGEQLEVEVELRYNVLHAGGDALARLERATRSEMTRVADEPPPREWNDAGSNPAGGISARERWRAYEVEASGAVERAVRAVYVNLFAPAEPVAVFVVNPDKRRMDPSLDPSAAAAASGTSRGDDMSPAELEREESGYVYRYRYMGSEGRTAAWLSADRFAVLDLAAGPCALARVGAPIGSDAARLTTAWSLPRLAPLLLPHAREATRETPAVAAAAAAIRDAQFRARMSAVALSAVRHVVAPDVGAETLDHSRRVLLPIIALRDHDLFAPLSPASGARGVDVELVFSEARRLLQPGQSLAAASSTHNLHEHEHLAAAVLRARRAVTTAGFGDATREPRRVRAFTREYLDSETLLEEFRRSADLLASGLTHLGEDASAEDAFGRQRGMPNPRATGGTVSRDGPVVRDGTRVVPVYVLSLAGLPRVRSSTARVSSPPPTTSSSSCNPSATPRSPRRARTIRRVGTREIGARVRRRRGTREGGGEGGGGGERRGDDAESRERRRRRSGRRRARRGIRRRRRRVGSPSFPLERPRRSRATFGTHPTRRRRRREGARRARRAARATQRRARPTRGELVMVRRTPSLRSLHQLHHPLRRARGRRAAQRRLESRGHRPPRGSPRARRDGTVRRRVSQTSLADVFPFPRERRAAALDGVAPSAATRDGPREPEQTWLDYLYADPDRAGVPGPLPQTTVAEMERNVERLEDAFVRVGDAMYDGDLNAAHELSSAVLDDARAFEAYVAREVTAARDALGCCRTARRRRDGGRAAASALVVVAAGGGYLLLVFARGARTRGGASGREVGFELGLGGGVMRGSALRSARRRARAAAGTGSERRDAQIDDAGAAARRRYLIPGARFFVAEYRARIARLSRTRLR